MVQRNEKAYDLALLCTYGVLICIQLGWALRAAVSAKAFSAACSAFQSLREAWRTRGKQGMDEIDRIVEANMQKGKLERCLVVGRILWLLFLCAGVIFSATIALGKPRGFTQAQDVLMVLTYVCLTVMQLLPETITQRTADWYYSLLCAMTILLVSPWCCSSDMVMQVIMIANLSRFVLGMMWRPLPLVIFWDAIFCLTVYSSVLMREETPPGIRRVPVGLFVQTAFCLSFVFSSLLVEGSRRAEMRAAVDAEGTRQAHFAAHALLRTFCDVVFEVSSEGVIDSPAWDLSSLLLRGRTLQGCKLADLLCEEDDRCRVREKMHASEPSGASLADVVHIRMKDIDGNVLRMEMFCFCFRGQDGQPRFLVGLREFGDGGPDGLTLRRRSSSSPASPVESGGRAAAPQAPAPDSIGVAEVLAEVDWERKGLPITSASPGFVMHMGRLPPHAKLLAIVEDRTHFNAWFQTSVNHFMTESSGAQAMLLEYQREVALTTRTGRKGATCTLRLEVETDLEINDQRMKACFVFSDFRDHSKKRGRASSGSNGSASGRSSSSQRCSPPSSPPSSPRSSCSSDSSSSAPSSAGRMWMRGTCMEPHSNNTGTLASPPAPKRHMSL